MMKTGRNYTSELKEMMVLVMYRTIFVPLTFNTQDIPKNYQGLIVQELLEVINKLNFSEHDLEVIFDVG